MVVDKMDYSTEYEELPLGIALIRQLEATTQSAQVYDTDSCIDAINYVYNEIQKVRKTMDPVDINVIANDGNVYSVKSADIYKQKQYIEELKTQIYELKSAPVPYSIPDLRRENEELKALLAQHVQTLDGDVVRKHISDLTSMMNENNKLRDELTNSRNTLQHVSTRARLMRQCLAQVSDIAEGDDLTSDSELETFFAQLTEKLVYLRERDLTEKIDDMKLKMAQDKAEINMELIKRNNVDINSADLFRMVIEELNPQLLKQFDEHKSEIMFSLATLLKTKNVLPDLILNPELCCEKLSQYFDNANYKRNRIPYSFIKMEYEMLCHGNYRRKNAIRQLQQSTPYFYNMTRPIESEFCTPDNPFANNKIDLTYLFTPDLTETITNIMALQKFRDMALSIGAQ